jgi:hypothetical protein
MSQRNVELLLGRLLTDAELRRQFVRTPRDVVDAFRHQGWELTEGEVDALIATDATTWSELARRIPSRLQRCNLRTG